MPSSTMLRRFCTFIAAVLALNSVAVAAADGLGPWEKPSYLQPCRRSSPDFRACFTQALHAVFQNWRGELMQKDAMPLAFEPIYVENVQVLNDHASLAPINLILMNLTTTGISEAKINDLRVNNNNNNHNNDFNFNITYALPMTHMSGYYSVKGQLLLLKLDTEGKVLINTGATLNKLTFKMKLRRQEPYSFFELKALRYRLLSIKGVTVQFDNLFKDDFLTTNTNEAFNRNWQLFFEIFKPQIDESVQNELNKRFRQLFAKMPANFLIADL